jgi:CRISPR/Cas system-associated endonuclease Cas3-HD
MVLDEIANVKRKLANECIYIERMRGLINIEEKPKKEEQEEKVMEKENEKVIEKKEKIEEEASNFDHELNVTDNDISVKSLNNKEKRLETNVLGFLVYGRNLDEGKLRAILKTCRSHVRSKN